jgi:hypothetical protein
MNQIDKEALVRPDASINPTPRRRTQARRGLLAFALSCALFAALGAAPAMANIGISTFSNAVLNQDGTTAATQAGSHPYEMVTNVGFATDASGAPTDNIKDVKVGLPPGLIGNPTAVPRCPIAKLNVSGGFGGGSNGCPGDSQVGQLAISIPGGGALSVPLYNLLPPAGEPAQFGANILLANSFLDVTVNTGTGYGLTTTSSNISTLLPLVGIKVTLWGVPADPSHDADRFCADGTTPCSTSAPMTPFLTLPTTCTGPLQTTLAADAWDSPQGDFVHNTSTMPGVTGCNLLSFNPSITARPDTTVADSPSGLDVDLHVPQAPNDPSALATPDVKNATVTLPQGFSLSPAAADGLQACSEAQFGLDNASEPTCPNASKIGTAEIDSPIQPDPLVGGIYFAQQNANPFGSTFAIYVATESDGVLIKLAANVQTNPVTGQITTTFTNNPQLPFTDFKLNFFGGSRAAFASPEGCGSFTTTSDVAPYSSPASGADATPSDSFAINSGCVGGFAPTFTAGTVSSQAGSFSPFDLSFSRSDTDQDLSGLTVNLPPGVSAKLAGIPECSDADIAQAQQPGRTGAREQQVNSCPASTQVGTVETAAGPGSDPFFLSGKVYLTGPFNGAPYGLVEIVPAVAGPLDLGVVVVRQSLNIDPTDAHVTVTSQPLPTILDGVPLRLRRVDVDLNRSGFTVNPTSCARMSISAALRSAGGVTANDSTRFQAAGCSSLAFSPKLKLSLTGKGKTRSGDHPTLTANLTQKAGQANIKSAKVTLPLSLALDPNNSKHVCAFATAQAVHGGAVGCPTSTVVGTASAKTPLLSQQLTGKVYLVQGIRTNAHGQQIRTLPSLLVPLRGQIALDLRAKTSVSKGKLVTTFPTVPDVPVSSFKLNLSGGKKGLLVITGRGRSICGSKQTSAATLDAQSGKQESSSIAMATPCKHVAKHPKKHKK